MINKKKENQTGKNTQENFNFVFGTREKVPRFKKEKTQLKLHCNRNSTAEKDPKKNQQRFL